jgi:hypothetical protein
MLIYLTCVSALLTYFIFQSRGIDYRAVALGSLLPTIIDTPIGDASFGHSFLFPVALLVVIMLATIGRSRLLRRQLLCIVIGLFFALVLEGTFMFESQWFWPAGGSNDDSIMTLYPSIGWWIIRDVLGLIAFYILFSIGELYKKEKRDEFFATGRING